MKRFGQNGFLVLFSLLIAAFPGMAPAKRLTPKGKPLNLEQCVELALEISTFASGQPGKHCRSKPGGELWPLIIRDQFHFHYNTSTANYSTVGGTTRSTGITRYSRTFYDIFSMGPTLNQLIYDFLDGPPTP